ncbi:unnamed protein product [Bemisia tabaci]|uniref:Pinin/SDK/MemA protein domain-containing protein n=1 Tax=Bemisia tabaci TaxID=7038 RepID=A0A9P0G131_BEMTA|nr:unnamed protein product [Bemisia tabaci]
MAYVLNPSLIAGSIEEELMRAKADLRSVEENLKRVTGRDMGGNTVSSRMKYANVPDTNDFASPEPWQHNANFSSTKERRVFLANDRARARPTDKRTNDQRVPAKRRLGDAKTVFSRLSGPPKKMEDSDEEGPPSKRPSISSRVVASVVPSRKEVLEVQRKDINSKDRNRRMFGALLGTLEKFKQEETKLKAKEDKKAQVERKLEEAAIKEQESVKRQREELFQSKKERKAEIRNLEIKLSVIKEFEEWEKSQKPLANFIQTKTSPHIFYSPKIFNNQTHALLDRSRRATLKRIEKRKSELLGSLEEFQKNKDNSRDDEEEEEEDTKLNTTNEKEDKTENQADLKDSSLNNESHVSDEGKQVMEVDKENELNDEGQSKNAGKEPNNENPES